MCLCLSTCTPSRRTKMPGCPTATAGLHPVTMSWRACRRRLPPGTAQSHVKMLSACVPQSGERPPQHQQRRSLQLSSASTLAPVIRRRLTGRCLANSWFANAACSRARLRYRIPKGTPPTFTICSLGCSQSALHRSVSRETPIPKIRIPTESTCTGRGRNTVALVASLRPSTLLSWAIRGRGRATPAYLLRAPAP